MRKGQVKPTDEERAYNIMKNALNAEDVPLLEIVKENNKNSKIGLSFDVTLKNGMKELVNKMQQAQMQIAENSHRQIK